MYNKIEFNENLKNINKQKEFGINFKKKPHTEVGNNITEITKKTLKITSLVETSVASAVIAINQDKKTKVDHNILAEEIKKRVNQGMPYKKICEELDISPSLYCKIIKEFNIQSPRQIARQNRENVNVEEFSKDVEEGILTREDILAKYKLSNSYISNVFIFSS